MIERLFRMWFDDSLLGTRERRRALREALNWPPSLWLLVLFLVVCVATSGWRGP